jgi:hypothetical protein
VLKTRLSVIRLCPVLRDGAKDFLDIAIARFPTVSTHAQKWHITIKNTLNKTKLTIPVHGIAWDLH